ncbi:hypothetical protein VNO77_21001 [Canavalia gladiata]|uniref:Uncharacterized protein n=1 Tax=Canavalia gladiata TaxID=3824 RepID=A0AAN9LTU1_CANGL
MVGLLSILSVIGGPNLSCSLSYRPTSQLSRWKQLDCINIIANSKSWMLVEMDHEIEAHGSFQGYGYGLRLHCILQSISFF